MIVDNEAPHLLRRRRPCSKAWGTWSSRKIGTLTNAAVAYRKRVMSANLACHHWSCVQGPLAGHHINCVQGPGRSLPRRPAWVLPPSSPSSFPPSSPSSSPPLLGARTVRPACSLRWKCESRATRDTMKWHFARLLTLTCECRAMRRSR